MSGFTELKPGLRTRSLAAMKILRVVVAFGAIVLGFGCGGPAAEPVAGMFPDYTLSSLGGTETSRADFSGKVVIYDFWATWCGPCHLQADIFREIYPGFAASGVEIVGIATGEEPATVRDFAAKRPFPWPILLDPEEKVSNELEVLGLPTLVITCKSGGAISFRQTGIVDRTRLERELAEAQTC